MPFYTVKEDATAEFYEKKSRFIGHIFFVTTEDEAMSKIKTIKEIYSDATHNCWAYSLRRFSSRRFSDDGEPQGTAGMPILSAIDNNGLSDVCIIVTRYFGGTLLGTGGLVRAYTKAAVTAIEKAEKAEILPFVTFSIFFSYDRLNRIKTIISKFPTEIIKEDYGENIYLEAKLPNDDFKILEKNIKNIYYDINFTIINENIGRLKN